MSDKEFDRFIFITLLVAVALISGRYFYSVWIRKGYMGKDGILDLFETKAFYLHVVGFIFVGVIMWMIHRDQNEREAWIVVGSISGGIFGGEIVADLKKSFKRPQRQPDENR